MQPHFCDRPSHRASRRRRGPSDTAPCRASSWRRSPSSACTPADRARCCQPRICLHGTESCSILRWAASLPGAVTEQGATIGCNASCRPCPPHRRRRSTPWWTRHCAMVASSPELPCPSWVIVACATALHASRLQKAACEGPPSRGSCLTCHSASRNQPRCARLKRAGDRRHPLWGSPRPTDPFPRRARARAQMSSPVASARASRRGRKWRRLTRGRGWACRRELFCYLLFQVTAERRCITR